MGLLAAQGSDLDLTAFGRTGTNQSQDIDSITLTIEDANSNIIVGPVSLPPIVRVTLGHYVYTWAIPSLQTIGTYYAQWSGIGDVDGSVLAGLEEIQVVAEGYISTSAFFPAPDGYEDVRNLLGVTDLDLTNEVIASAPFLGQAELMLKRAVSDWETNLDVDKQTLLRLASEYATAALIAESMAKGGFMSLVRTEGGNRDWDKMAALLWSRYFSLMSAGDEPSGQLYMLPMLYRTSPTRRARAGETSAGGFTIRNPVSGI